MSFIDKDNLTIISRKKKTSLKVVKRAATLKFYLPAQEGKASPLVTPILGQFKINPVEFFKKFNSLTTMCELGLPMSVIIYKMSNETLEIIIKGPALVLLLWLSLNENIVKFLPRNLLYDIICIESRKQELSLRQASRIVFGSLRSLGIRGFIK